MKRIPPFLLFLFISLSVLSSNAKSTYSDVEKLISWAQYFALEEGLAIEYRSASLRNGMLEIRDLSIKDNYLINEDIDIIKINSLDKLIAANQNTASETIFSAKKIKINFGYLEKFLIFVMTRDRDMIKEFYKSDTYLLFDEIKISSGLSSVSSEFSSIELVMVFSKITSPV